jgi:hypothetical protein
MQLSCPKCGTREVRVSHRRTVAELVRSLVGIYPMRCRRCRHRWETSAWFSGAWKYARCPRCYRQELTTWSEQYYHPPSWTKFLLRVGATPYRCAACRCNFASFKRCKERFSWRHKTRVEPAPGAGPIADQPVAGEAPEAQH